MFKLLKGGYCFSPNDLGIKDILLGFGKIIKVEENILVKDVTDIEIIDCQDCFIFPGMIDQHVHITGGGGEQGPASRIPEIMLGELTTSGVTTVVGVLGFDSITRGISGLLAKARALQIEGMNTFIYTGSYSVPTATLTGKISTDIAYVDKVIGVGEIALSDHRSSHPSLELLKELAFEARIGGLTGGKAGIVHIHFGDGKKGLKPLQELVDESDFPIEMFVPTHVNRNKALFQQGIEFVIKGGQIDLTAGEKSEVGYSVPDALEILFGSGTNLDRITVSSDGNGSIPSNNGSNGVGKVSQLFYDIRDSIQNKKLKIEHVMKTVTVNVAKILKLYPQKGTIQYGSDADLLIVNKKDFSINKVFINGDLFINGGNIIRKGGYEK